MAHIDAGKTTSTERILFYTGVTYKIGSVDEGTATMDWMEQERERGITITSRGHYRLLEAQRQEVSRQHYRHAGSRGFHGGSRALAARAGRRGAVYLTPSRACSRNRKPCGARPTSTTCRVFAFVNKMDRIGADFDHAIRPCAQRLGAHPVPLQFPIGAEDQFIGVIDLIERKSLSGSRKPSARNSKYSSVAKLWDRSLRWSPARTLPRLKGLGHRQGLL